jgi:hypothetical protein
VIMAFAITVHTHGFNINTAGWILLVVGIVVLLIGIVVFVTGSRSRAPACVRGSHAQSTYLCSRSIAPLPGWSSSWAGRRDEPP